MQPLFYILKNIIDLNTTRTATAANLYVPEKMEWGSDVFSNKVPLRPLQLPDGHLQVLLLVTQSKSTRSEP